MARNKNSWNHFRVKAPEIDGCKVGCVTAYYPLYNRQFEAAFTLEMISRIVVKDH